MATRKLQSIQLCGTVSSSDVQLLLREAAHVIDVQYPTRCEVDCSAVTYITGFALQMLVKKRRELAMIGADLRLIGCSQEVRNRMIAEPFLALVA